MTFSDSTKISGSFLPKKAINEVVIKEPLVKGFKYPMENTLSDFFSKGHGIKLIKGMLNSFLRTRRGERFMLPDYGANLENYLMEPLDEITFKLIKDEIESSVKKYFNILKIEKLQAFETRGGGLLIKLFLGLKDSQSSNFNIEVRI